MTVVQFIERYKFSEVSVDGFHKVTVRSIRDTVVLISGHIAVEECLRTLLRPFVFDDIRQERLERPDVEFNVFRIPFLYRVTQSLDFSVQFLFGLFIRVDDELIPIDYDGLMEKVEEANQIVPED